MAKVVGFILLASLAINSGLACAAESISGIRVTLPANGDWQAATDQSDGTQYLKEWILKGSTLDSTKWLIVEQKILLPHKISAKQYIQNIFELARSACTDVLYNGPDKLDVAGSDTYVGRFMCAQQNGKNYGTFTDQRVMTTGKVVYVVTSEIRLPPTPKAGEFAFEKDQAAAMGAFMQLQKLSASLVRESVHVCTAKTNSC